MQCAVVGVLALAVMSLAAARQEGDTNSYGNSTSDMGRNIGNYQSAENRLLNDLLKRYKRNQEMTRPVMDSRRTVYIYLRITIIQVLDFNVKEQTLTTLIWKNQEWTDEYLRWDPKDYDGVDRVRIKPDKVWVPDIVLYSNVGPAASDEHTVALVVTHNGNVTWVPGVKYHSSCPCDMTDYPFDEQTCVLRFGPWTYDQQGVDMEFADGGPQVDLSQYVNNSEWDIIRNVGQKNVRNYACCTNNYTDLTFHLTFKRQVTFHLRLLMLPTVLLSAMSVAIFWIPPSRPDRTALGLSLFSSFFLLLILVVTSSPPSASTKLGTYYMLTILLVSMGIILSIVTINICQMTRDVPSIVEQVFIPTFACLLCIHQSHSTTCEGVKEEELKFLDLKPKMKRPSDYKQNAEKWKTFASILDRLYFIVFFVAMLTSFACIFPQPSQLLQVML